MMNPNFRLAVVGVAAAMLVGGCSSKSKEQPQTQVFPVSVSTIGSGSVVSTPAGIDCGSVCTGQFADGTTVTLTPTAVAGNQFIDWGGACDAVAATNACVLTVSQALTVTAEFFPQQSLGDTYVLTAGNILASFDRDAPENILSTVQITGLLNGEQLVGIDFRPSDGKLYAVSTEDKLYTIDHTATGKEVTALEVATIAETGVADVILATETYGVDVNPVVDALRVVGSDGSNRVVNLSNGTVTRQTNIAAGNTLNGAAYSNNYAGTTSTALYVIDSATDQLKLQNPASGGTPTLIGDLTVQGTKLDAGSVSGFEITGGTNQLAFAALNVSGAKRLYSINVATGTAIFEGSINIAGAVRGLAIPPAAAPAAAANTVVITSFDDGHLVATIDRNSTESQLPLRRSSRVSGLAVGDRLVAADYRPVDGLLYGLGFDGNLYQINPNTGVAEQTVSLSAASGATFNGLSGANFGMAFDPQDDTLRVVSSGRQNLQIDVDTGEVTPQGQLFFENGFDVPPSSDNENAIGVAVAYTNKFDGTLRSTAYVLEPNFDELHTLSESDGDLGSSGENGLTIDASGIGALQIDAVNGAAFAALQQDGVTRLYSISLGAGVVTNPRQIGDGARGVIALTWKPVLPVNIHAITTDNRLVSFAPSDPSVMITDQAITGMAASEEMVAIAYRQTDRVLVGVGSGGRIYTINPTTAVATLVSTLDASSNDFTDRFDGLDAGLNGFGASFDPTLVAAPGSASLRITSASEENYRVVPASGETFTDPLIYPDPDVPPGTCDQGGTPQLGAVAHENSFLGAQNTVAYVIDANLSCVFRLDRGTGELATVAQLYNPSTGDELASATSGFVIVGGHNGLRVAAVDDDAGESTSNLIEINTAATQALPSSVAIAATIGRIAAGAKIRAMAVTLRPAP